jgi:nitronate monooxygenase
MSRLILHSLMYPIVQAPMAGGPSTPSLAAAVSGAGGLGFLAAGYKTVDRVERELAEVRSLMPVGLPYGLNLLAPPGHGTGAAEVSSYADKLRNEAQERDVALGNPRWDDDQYGEKLDLLCEQAVPVVSLTFGCPTPSEVDRLQSSGSAVWITVTTVGEARAAQHVGADALVVQGVEAGGHRGGFDDAHPGDIGLLALLQLVQAAVNDGLPLIAAGGLITGRGVAAVLACGAAAAQLGTAFMLCPEAGTVPAHQDMISRDDAPTALTRAFTGRTARGIVNRFLEDHADAPSAYPEIHHLTAPLRTAARTRGDAHGFHLWAGQAHALAQPLPAAELVVRLALEAREALETATL